MKMTQTTRFRLRHCIKYEFAAYMRNKTAYEIITLFAKPLFYSFIELFNFDHRFALHTREKKKQGINRTFLLENH